MKKLILSIAVAIALSLSACGVNDTLGNGPSANYVTGEETISCTYGYEPNETNDDCIPVERK